MRLFIAEKPSLARAIAAGLGKITDKSDHHIAVGDDTITWCYGHILNLAPPEDYRPELAKWSLDTLPIVIPDDGWKLVIKQDARVQYHAIGKMMRKARIVINAGDPDREGQMLVDEVIEAHQWRGETQRILITNTTPEGIRQALRRLEPNSKHRPLYEAAKCRSRADWLVGMNLTRAATKRIGPKTSIGRVQTPTLSLVVKRDREIEGHTASHYYPLHAHLSNTQGAAILVHDPKQNRITDINIARKIEKALLNSTVKINTMRGEEKQGAPLPFMLSSFQSAAEKAHGWGAKESLQVLQGLYEAQLTTYPRSDCPYLPEEQAGAARRIAQTIIDSGLVAGADNRLFAHMAPRKAVYDDAKVAEHHGIIPTGKAIPDNLSPKLREGWILVARRFLQSLLPPLINDVTEWSFVHEERKFSAKRAIPQNLPESWLHIEPPKARGEEASSIDWKGPVPSAIVTRLEIKTAKTSPPSRYTEATLIEDMKSVGKFVDDPRLKAILKGTAGIGTPATHAAIIETLKERGYIELQGRGKVKTIISTTFGRYLIDNLPRELSDPGVTALWEEQLNLIAKGEAQPAAFMARINEYVGRYVAQIKGNTFAPLPPGAPVPASGSGTKAEPVKARKPYRKAG